MSYAFHITWGEALHAKAARHKGGLKAAVERIQAQAGRNFGTRNTFAALTYLDEAPEPGTNEYERAYLLLTVLGEDPREWGVDPELVPVVLRSVSSAWITRRSLAAVGTPR